MDVYRVDSESEPFAGWTHEAESSFVVNPPAGLLDDVVGTALEKDRGTIRTLLTAETASTLSDDFLLETRLAEARMRDRLAVRVVDGPLDDKLLLHDESARVLVPVEETVGIFETDAGDLVEDLRKKYESYWADGESLRTRAPPRPELYETAEDRLSDEFVTDLRRVLQAAEELDWYGTPTPVEVALVVAGRASEHLYDVSRWGEDAAFASRSSLSRAKNTLDDEGVLRIERVPQERGRPRQRLLVGDDRLDDADPTEIVPVMRSVLPDAER